QASHFTPNNPPPMSDLKGELEKRKARLALLRQQKAEAAAAATAGATSGHHNPQQSAAATSVATTETAEDILRELGIDPTPSAPVDPKLSASDTSPPSSSKLSPPPLDAPQAQAKPLKHLSVSRLTQTSVCQPAHYCKETQTLQQVDFPSRTLTRPGFCLRSNGTTSSITRWR
uniref:WH2 domain-containing protein n=1 Tax=Macrostomum lignano TaxID=282301 RepID=A0A1I8G8Q2_9PLAT